MEDPESTGILEDLAEQFLGKVSNGMNLKTDGIGDVLRMVAKIFLMVPDTRVRALGAATLAVLGIRGVIGGEAKKNTRGRGLRAKR